MSVSIKKEFKCFPTQEQIELNRVVTAVLGDITALKAASAAFTAKLDSDITAGGASETNYAATVDALQASNLTA